MSVGEENLESSLLFLLPFLKNLYLKAPQPPSSVSLSPERHDPGESTQQEPKGDEEDIEDLDEYEELH